MGENLKDYDSLCIEITSEFLLLASEVDGTLVSCLPSSVCLCAKQFVFLFMNVDEGKFMEFKASRA